MFSILQRDDSKCFICGQIRWLEWHHVFGAALKKLSEKYGLMVRLCHFCHNEPPNGVHQNREIRRKLQAFAQAKAMKTHDLTKEEFIKLFGKNYL